MIKFRKPISLMMAVVLVLSLGVVGLTVAEPVSAATAGASDLIVLDQDGEQILRITPTGAITVEVTEADILAATGEGDVNFNDDGIAFDTDVVMYFAESESDDILKRAPGGAVTVLTAREAIIAVTGGEGADPDGLAFGNDGFLYVCDDDTESVLRVNPSTGAVSMYVTEAEIEAMPGITSVNDVRSGIVGDERGNIYVAIDGDPDAVIAIAPDRTLSVLASGPFNDLDVFMTRAPNGDLIVADNAGADTIYRVTTEGAISTFLSEATLEAVTGQDVDLEGGIAFDSAGNFYIAEEATDDILRFDTRLTGSIWVTEEAMEAASGAGDVDLEAGIAFAPGAPLVANFSASPAMGDAPLTVKFQDRSTGGATWHWSFGDGNTSTARNPEHTYQYEGFYTVCLTVTRSGGTDTRCRTNYILVEAQAVAARLVVRDLNITPAYAQPRQAVGVSANVFNDGGTWGSGTVNLMINGQFEQSVSVGVSPGTAQPVSFIVYKVEPGEYQVGVDGAVGTFYVVEEEPVAPQGGGLLAGGELDQGGIIAIIVIGVILVGGVVVAIILTRPS